MESKNRNVWIVVVLALVLACCCALAAATAAITWYASSASSCCGGSLHRERIEKTFAIGDAPTLKVNNSAGAVTVRAGEKGAIHVVAIKKAEDRSELHRIGVEMSEGADGLAIETRGIHLLSNAVVELEITTPANTRLDLHTGTASVEVRGIRSDVKVDSSSGGVTIAGVTGDIVVHTGTGGIEVRGASGAARLDSTSGGIEYQGTLRGDCRFKTLSGGVELKLPAELNMEVDLGSGSGSVELDYAVSGRPTERKVKGVIGDGSQGSIYAHSWSGSVELLRH